MEKKFYHGKKSEKKITKTEKKNLIKVTELDGKSMSQNFSLHLPQ